MHLRSLRVISSPNAILSLAVILAVSACGDSSTSAEAPLFDSRLIAFVSDSGNSDSVSEVGGTSIFVMHADGTHKQRLTSAHFQDQNPRWSPDGSSITFETNRAPAGIWIMNADGSNERPLLTNSAFGVPNELHWSPDGHSIAFGAYASESGPERVIMIADANGSHSHRFIPTARNQHWPSWSPDGTKIAFMGEADSVGYSIYVANADGTALLRLSFGTDFMPEWSPDGSRIVFVNLDVENPSGSRIFVMQKDGSHQVALSTGDEDEPTWSPDGRQLAFERYGTESAPNGPLEIYRMNADGSRALAITVIGSTPQAFYQAQSPVWKPTP
jgi:Tol biopolymer transport system component